MHILSNERPVPIGPGKALKAGEWLVEDSAAAQIMAQSGGGECKVRPWPCDIGEKHGVKSILVIRPGRYGDLICLTPALRRLKELNPDTHIAVATLPNYREPLNGLPYIDEFIMYPVAVEEARRFQHIISLEMLQSLADKEQVMHITDLFAERCGLDPAAMTSKVPDLFLGLEEINWAHDSYPKKHGQKRIAFHVRSSSRSRDYPMANMNALMVRLHSEGHEIMFLGTENQFKWATKDKPPGIIFTPEHKLTFRQSVAALYTCDVLFGPDSAMIHAAAALDIPSVGVFSTVPWKLRTAYYPKCFVLQGKNPCPLAPCFSAPMSNNPHAFPADGPCATSWQCDALHAIHPDRVASKILEILGEKAAR